MLEVFGKWTELLQSHENQFPVVAGVFVMLARVMSSLDRQKADFETT
jgi:hypothetical protein